MEQLTFQSIDTGPIGDFTRMFAGDSKRKQESSGLPKDGAGSNLAKQQH